MSRLILLPTWNTASCTLCDFVSTTSAATSLGELLDHYYTTHATENR